VLASIASVVINLPILKKQSGAHRSLPTIVTATVIQIVAGAAALLLEAHLAKLF
jgi:hypothetical protein